MTLPGLYYPPSPLTVWLLLQRINHRSLRAGTPQRRML